MKLLYKPFSLIAGVIAGRLGKSAFRGLWSKIDKDEPPTPGAPETTMAKVVGAAALEAATTAAVAAAVDRAAAATFHHLFGAWPDSGKESDGDKKSDRDKKSDGGEESDS